MTTERILPTECGGDPLKFKEKLHDPNISTYWHLEQLRQFLKIMGLGETKYQTALREHTIALMDNIVSIATSCFNKVYPQNKGNRSGGAYTVTVRRIKFIHIVN